ncbi:SIMPL domain-containing protein [Candidatus Thiothrix sp. Deng01]|uniref:SIMPL domain-containing protein n=1 Tax=Candidatus Thiothrix phosphatis TaxID=3112415 RepID=A0ABU6D301_9GAMM|nr:SIMPL domain-containing protein [Candidatus Thiothrix sp. Deng01]MEB4593460.1 SIMPL domain-containing protein [Candidatus Thiothrix sp. Deng01]
MKKQLAVLLLGLSALGMAYAEDKPTYDRVSFSVSAAKEVANDLSSAVLYAEQQGQNTVTMADTVNQAITWAMDIAKQESAVESRTLDYTTNPIYTDGKITGWQVRQSIQLKSKDSKVLSTLLGTLQEKLRIEGISYSVSPEVQSSTEDDLINTALANFKKRADQVKANLGRAEYRVVKLDVQSISGEYPQPPMYRMAAMEAPAPAPPTLASGKQNLQVNVQAEIELSTN